MLTRNVSCRPVTYVSFSAVLMSLLMMGGCGHPEPSPIECTIEDTAIPECRTPAAFEDEPDAYRIEQLSRGPQEQTAIVPLQPGDHGRILHVYPTTDRDAWDDGGEIEFLDAAGESLCSRAELCVSAFADGDWIIPDGAASAALHLPTAVFATVLFTIVII